jgi:hypothetical protein
MTTWRWFESFGLRWPVPDDWRKVGEGVFQGENGLLKVITDEGELIDPARCMRAKALRDGEWHLARTVNGITIAGAYTEQRAMVRVFAVRVDGEDPSTLGEVQATYAIASSKGSDALLSDIEHLLQVRTLRPDEFGRLDAQGHSSMGPVPVLRTWHVVGEPDGALPKGSEDAASQMFVGGGWLVLADESECCGLLLQPMPWKHVDNDRADRFLRAEFEPKGLALHHQSGSVAVWCTHRVADHGYFYVARENDGRARFVGAFWSDPFDQVWRLQYWLGRPHGDETARLLGNAAATTR